jgi:hypothetical protein
MDKKLVFSVAATAITLAVTSGNAYAAAAAGCSGSAGAAATPSLQAVGTAATGCYNVSAFNFTPSANVQILWDATISAANQAGDTAVVSAANTAKGTRSYAGAVGAVSGSPRACTTTDVTTGLTASAPSSALVLTTCVN